MGGQLFVLSRCTKWYKLISVQNGSSARSTFSWYQDLFDFLFDLIKFPTWKGLGKCIKKLFNSSSGKVKLQYWACAKEKHQNHGEQNHVALQKGYYQMNKLWSIFPIFITNIILHTAMRMILYTTVSTITI